MLSWHIVFCLVVSLKICEANLFQQILGIPTECVHDNVVRSCKLSFSCWLEGGRHHHGCGGNKWLFSCCIPEYNISPVQKVLYKPVPANNNILKKSILRRRFDADEDYFECGIPQSSKNMIQKRIIGGRQAKFAEYPWQAHIRISEYQCGGVLVSRRFVATAAHCISNSRLRDIVVYLGELDTQNSGKIIEPLPAEKHRVSNKIIHPRFRFRITQPDRYDIALLKLTKPAGYKAHILPICLPAYPIDLTGKKGVIAGWGKTTPNMGHTGTNLLRTASVPILTTSECIKWHKSKDIRVEIFPEMFCAGHKDGKTDACLGDSGGPLVVMEKGRYVLVGITSAGFGCGVDHQPGIYHNVQKTSKWIQSVIYS